MLHPPGNAVNSHAAAAAVLTPMPPWRGKQSSAACTCMTQEKTAREKRMEQLKLRTLPIIRPITILHSLNVQEESYRRYRLVCVAHAAGNW